MEASVYVLCYLACVKGVENTVKMVIWTFEKKYRLL